MPENLRVSCQNEVSLKNLRTILQLSHSGLPQMEHRTLGTSFFMVLCRLAVVDVGNPRCQRARLAGQPKQAYTYARTRLRRPGRCRAPGPTASEPIEARALLSRPGSCPVSPWPRQEVDRARPRQQQPGRTTHPRERRSASGRFKGAHRLLPSLASEMEWSH